MRCKDCGREIEKFEHYVKLKDGTILDETCFFNRALIELKAEGKQNGFEYVDED